MATVRITEKLIDSVIRNVRLKFNPAIDAAKKSLDTTGWADRIYDTVYGAYLPQINALPPGFISARDGIDIRFYKEGRSILSDSWKLKFTTPKPLPDAMPDNPYAEFTETWRNYEYKIKDWTPWPDLWEAIETRAAKILQVQDDEQTMKDSVRKLLRSHSTLAPCLKKWPALWDLLDDEFKDRHKEVVERKGKDKDSAPEYDLDFDRMTAMVAKAKLRGV